MFIRALYSALYSAHFTASSRGFIKQVQHALYILKMLNADDLMIMLNKKNKCVSGNLSKF